MMQDIIAQLREALQNQIVGGGLVLMLVGAVMALARSVPTQILAWVKRRITVEVEVLNSDPLFEYVTFWLDKHPYTKKSRRLTASLDSNRGDNSPQSADDPPEMPNIMFSPAPGRHLFFYGRTIVWLERERESGKPAGDAGFTSLRKHERYSITVLGRGQACIRKLLDEAMRLGAKPKDSIKVYTQSYGCWECRTMTPRQIESVVLPGDLTDDLVADARLFLSREQWYRNTGIPWHRGYLLHGLPGTGKTSIVTALAGEMKMSLYLLQVSGSGMTDEKLHNLMGSVRPNSIVLMEDVDCTFPTRDASKDKDGVTLSGLLNCLDGVQSREGCMIFMTTNRKEALDSALLRPGRVDFDLEFGLATEDQIVRIKDRIRPEVSDGAAIEACAGKTMAEVQQWLLAPDAAVISN